MITVLTDGKTVELRLENWERVCAHIAELEAALTTIRDTLPLVQDEYSRRVFNVAADVLDKT